MNQLLLSIKNPAHSSYIHYLVVSSKKVPFAESRKLHNKVAPQFEKEFVHAIDDTNMYILSLLSPIIDFVNQKIDDPAIFLSDSKPYQASN